MADPAWLDERLSEWRRRGLERELRPSPPLSPDVLNFADNDYLNLSRHPDVIAAATTALHTDGAGARASRVMAGNLACHRLLEQQLARLKGFPDALLFGSGFLANLGIMTALAERGDAVLIDRLAHASLIDGARLSGARILRFRHNDPEHLQALLRKTPATRRRLVVTESVFSMDGDQAPLRPLARAAEDAGAMFLVDEAHATGVFGEAGAGLAHSELLGDMPSVVIGTLSKALGSYGGFTVCSDAMRTYLIQRARSFTYSTALPPAAAAAAQAALNVCQRQPHPGHELLRRANRFRKRLQTGGANTGASASQIVPVMLGDNMYALRLAEELRRHNIFCLAIRPPTVPPGCARIRFSITSRHHDADLDRTADLTLDIMRRNGLC